MHDWNDEFRFPFKEDSFGMALVEKVLRIANKWMKGSVQFLKIPMYILYWQKSGVPYGWTGLTKDIFLETVDVLFEEIFPEIIVQYLPEAFFSFFWRDGIIYSWELGGVHFSLLSLEDSVSARKIKSRGWLLEVGCWDFTGGPVAVLSVHGDQLRSLVMELDPTFHNWVSMLQLKDLPCHS